MKHPIVVPCIVLGTVLLSAAGCGGSKHPPAQNAAASAPAADAAGAGSVVQGSAKVTYQPLVHAMEKAEALQALKAQSSDGNGFIFDSKYAKAAALKAGDVLLIKNLLARKVLASETTADGIVVITQGASLVDVVKDGHIAMNAAMHFKAPGKTADTGHPLLQFLSALMPGSRAMAQDWSNNTRNPSQPAPNPGVGHNEQTGPSAGTMYDNAKKSPYLKPFKGTLQDWDIEWDATPADGRINLNLSMSKNVKGIVAKITGTGYLTNFEFINDMDIGTSPATAASALMQAAGQFKSIKGAMDFNWELGKSTPGPGGDAETIKLPGALSIPMASVLEGIPLTIEVSAAIEPHPMMTAGNQYSSGSFHVTYDGYQRFKLSNGSLDADGPMSGEPTADAPHNISAVAPFGVAVAFAAPRIDLVFGGAGLISSEDLKSDAKWADTLIDQAAKRLLNPDSYQSYKASGFSMAGAAAAFDHTNATFSLRVIASSTMTASGSSQMTLPCSKSTLDLSVYVGASAQALGLSAGSASKRIMDKTFEKIDPAGARLCSTI
ncbi:MAG TPA: hypothetical protein VHW71_07585 [Steroidobacteraceae bacterium]|nr:hypothetical protein [Steroidobacteraceae bacterium]